MMAEGHRLRGLQMGEARHDGRGVLLGAVEEDGDQALQRRRRRARSSRFTHSRKSTATWSLRERAVCRRPAAGADQLGKPRLDIHVDVFEPGREVEFAGLDLCQDRVQPVSDFLLIGRPK